MFRYIIRFKFLIVPLYTLVTVKYNFTYLWTTIRIDFISLLKRKL